MALNILNVHQINGFKFKKIFFDYFSKRKLLLDLEFKIVYSF